MPLFALAGAIGAAIAYFFDSDNGQKRRKLMADRAGMLFRQTGQQARGAAAQAGGLKQKATHLKERPKPQPDDVTLARKVESEIFRDPEVPKGKINVNAEDGVVYLRGEVEERDLIEDLETKVRGVQGVVGVQVLLHLPGEEAPAKPE